MADLGTIGRVGVFGYAALLTTPVTWTGNGMVQGVPHVRVVATWLPTVFGYGGTDKQVLDLSLSGTVRDSADQPVSRTVRVANRRNGKVLAQTTSASDGTWALLVSESAECNVICLDDAAGTTYNDLIARATPG